jgi:hypothetical protein
MKITRDHLVAVPNQATPLQGVAHRGGRPSVATGPPYDRTEGLVALFVDGPAAAVHDAASFAAGSVTNARSVTPLESRTPIGYPESAVR